MGPTARGATREAESRGGQQGVRAVAALPPHPATSSGGLCERPHWLERDVTGNMRSRVRGATRT